MVIRYVLITFKMGSFCLKSTDTLGVVTSVGWE